MGAPTNMRADARHEPPIAYPSALEGNLRRGAWRIVFCRRVEWIIQLIGIAAALVVIYEAASGTNASGPFALAALTAAAAMWVLVRVARRSAYVLADVGSVADIPVLIEAHGTVDNETRQIAAWSLKRLLPRLQASDGELLSHAHRATLNGVLRRCANLRGRQDPDLAIAVLAAWEQVGDANALPVVEELARSSRFPQLRKHAAECLPALTARVEQDADRGRLLRPAEEQQVAGALLRPASAGPIDESLLLRPTDE